MTKDNVDLVEFHKVTQRTPNVWRTVTGEVFDKDILALQNYAKQVLPLLEKIKEQDKVLEYYANKENYVWTGQDTGDTSKNILLDNGTLARKQLSKKGIR